MNTKLTIALVAVLVVGLLAYIAWRAPESKDSAMGDKDNMEESMNTEDKDMANQVTPTSGTASFAYLMGSGHELKCDIVYEPQSGTSVVAVVYVDGEHMRVNSEMMMAGETYLSHIIMDHDMVYTWNESGVSNMAVKFRVEDSDMNVNEVSGGREVDLNQEVEYDCQSWNVDGSVFVPPADIEFMDMEDMMRGGAGFNGNVQVQ